MKIFDVRPHVIIVNRWAERYADYSRYLNHQTHLVTYVATEVGRAAIPAMATDVVIVPATDDLAAVRAAVRRLAGQYGPPSYIVALKEDDLLAGAELRAEWDCPGPRMADLTVFRDKYIMATAVSQTGLVPAFNLANDPRMVFEFAQLHGWPVIVKPLLGSSSAGVLRLRGPADISRVNFSAEKLLVQKFNPDPIYHVDGIFDGRELITSRASRYLNSCLDFRGGSFLGSVEESDVELGQLIADRAAKIMRALSSTPTVFHLELFVNRRARTCAFLEVGARVGGAEIPFIWREIHGHDLMESAFRIQLGLEPSEVTAGGHDFGGWLLIHAPAHRPCKITEVTPMVGRNPGPYAEALPSRGDILPQADSYYEYVGGRFRFRGSSSVEVETAILSTVADFRVEAVSVSLSSSGGVIESR